jgi:hypothetical protein
MFNFILLLLFFHFGYLSDGFVSNLACCLQLKLISSIFLFFLLLLRAVAKCSRSLSLAFVDSVVLEPLFAAFPEFEMLLFAFLIEPGEPASEDKKEAIKAAKCNSNDEPLVPDLILYGNVLCEIKVLQRGILKERLAHLGVIGVSHDLSETFQHQSVIQDIDKVRIFDIVHRHVRRVFEQSLVIIPISLLRWPL